MISTDAGGEGLNLQFCHVVVNFDMPWNPMRVEQRIGRVDRIGQPHIVRAINFVLEDTVEHRVREVLETKLAVIAEEFGVDKAADVMDSVAAEPLFDELFVEGLQDPEAIETKCDAVISQLRSTFAESRKQSELLSDGHELKADDARKWRDHPARFWLERAVINGLPARGGAAVKEGNAWRVCWVDGSEPTQVCFDARAAEERPEIEWVTLEDPRARAVISELPRCVEGQPLPAVTIKGLPESVEGVWSLWEISLSAEDFSRRRFLTVFVTDDLRTFMPTAKRIWDLLLTEQPDLASEACIDSTGRWFHISRDAARAQGERLFSELVEERRGRISEERERERHAYEARNQAIGRIGLPAVREHRRKQLLAEHEARLNLISAAEACAPDLNAVLMLRIGRQKAAQGRAAGSTEYSRSSRRISPASGSRLTQTNVLLDERVLSSLRERGFELLPFEDSVSFRTEYEERYRAAWDRGAAGPSRALILHLRATEVDNLPWDYLRASRRTSLSLANLFPKLSYNVVRQIGSEHYEALFEAQKQHNTQSLGDGATEDFILTHIFGISPYLISRPEDLWRELLRLHYRGDGLPPVLASHVATVLETKVAFRTLPIGDLFSSKSLVLRVVQSAWDRFLALKGVKGSRAADANLPEEIPDAAIPFEHPDVRVIVDSMFLDGTLQPLEAQERPNDVPDWMRVGIVEDPEALEKLVIEGARRLAAELPSIEASFRDWLQLSRRLGELIFRFHGIKPDHVDTIGTQVVAVQIAADEQLRAWVTRHYADLMSLPAAKSPVMVHQVPRYLSLRHDPRQTRVALLVFDGMGMDQWIQIREGVAQRAPDLSFEESACFAWLPTLTSVSRQALFSGLRPREFAKSIDTTSQEPTLWSRYWQDHGLRANEVLYRKAINLISAVGSDRRS